MAIIRNGNYKSITLMTSVLVQNVFVSWLKLCYWLHWLNFSTKKNPYDEVTEALYSFKFFQILHPANIYLFKVNNRNTGKKVRNMFKVNNNNTRTTSIPSGNFTKPSGAILKSSVSRSAILLRLCSQTENATVLKICTVIF